MVKANPPNDPLESALAKLVFHADIREPDIAKHVAGVLGLIGTAYRSQLGRLRRKLEKGGIKAEEATKLVVLYGLTEHLSRKLGITAREKRAEIYAELNLLAEQESELLIPAVRAFSNTSSDLADKEAARKLITILKSAIASDSEGENGEEREDNTMPNYDDMEELLKDKILQTLAFDESRLPENLHYDTDDDGNAAPSRGQLNFLIGTINALNKLGVDIDGRNGVAVLVGVISILLLDGYYDPDDRGFYDHVRTAYTELLEPASTKRAEIISGNDAFEANFSLKLHVFNAVIGVLMPEKELKEKVFFHALAAVYRGMVGKYDTRPPGSAGFGSSVKALYNDETLAAGGGGGGGSGIAYLDLPPLSDPEGGSEQIVKENIQAVSAIYVVYQCEQMLLFDVVDRIVELFMAGLLPMGGDTLARNLDDYYWQRDDRVSKAGRQAHYTRALGAPGGDIGGDVTPNTEFNPALMHVISSLSEFERQRNVGNLFEQRRGYTMATTGEYVRKSVRDLGANCTLYGYAGAQFAAERIGRQLKQAMDILQLPRIQEIYGVHSMWQVIERVAQSEFGTTVNVVKHRTLAEETRAILEIIAEKHHVWSLSSNRPLFTIDPDVPGDLTVEEGDRMFRAAQYFLAVNGVQNEQIYEYSQPTDTPALPSIPGMSGFGSGAGAPGMGGDGDVAGQLKEMLDRGQTPSADQIRAMVGF